MHAGLGRWRRIATAATFREALASRPRSRGEFFDVHCLPSPTPERFGSVSRLGLVVPKRICRLAAGRNRIKRLVRESFRHDMPVNVGCDCVVRLRRAIGPADVSAARSELIAHWQKVTA